MAGCRPLTPQEERRLLRVARKLSPLHRAVIMTLWWTGFRVAECLSLNLDQAWRNDAVVDNIGIAPRHLKGKRGRTRWVPVLPELKRALQSHVAALGRRYILEPKMPLFPSRELGPDGQLRPMTTSGARQMLHRAFEQAGILNDGRLGCHVLRKTWSRRVLANAGGNVAVLSRALQHSSLEVTARYIEVDQAEVEAAIRGIDFTRRPRLRVVTAPVPFAPAPTEVSPVPAPAVASA